MKAVFAELGIPSVIVSDGGPQYTSVEFKDFMKQWQIEHRVSSPQYPQSNGMAERYVQTMKTSLIKTMEEGEDTDMALLAYKAIPLSHNLPLPAELLNSRKYRTLLPTHIVPTSLPNIDKSWTMENKCRQTCTTNILEYFLDCNSILKVWFGGDAGFSLCGGQ